MKEATILGIESSCDDTAAAVMENGHLLSNVVSSQLDHKAFGGVVPEVASRAHVEHIIPVVKKALEEAGKD
ncbi:MAG: tRNA (adenosine(37)-N6)-threonylcarbamoyltransferase complex transferase subunit TsaD, partial [Saprospiraceae bacterium]|nr:tRNA (adenosine(37)-N6)-threonylcarbamoyltransferase complex transferase subunit TsaD [Saprospiraceae bacterium]